MRTPEPEPRLARRLAARLLPLSLAIAFLISVGLPTVYYVFGALALRRAAREDARSVANQIGALVAENPSLWKYDASRFEFLIYSMARDAVTSVRVLDEAGRQLAAHALGGPAAWWDRYRVTGAAPITFNNRVLGAVEVRMSQRVLLGHTAAFCLLSAVTGAVLALFVYRLPVRVVTKMEGRIEELLATLRGANADLERQAADNAGLYEETRRAYADLARAQDRLLEGQKLEAIGKLAGGIAHDFNNLLTVIVGRAEIALDRTGADDPRRKSIEVILKAASRAAALTQQILAFGRKQVLRPTVLDLNTVIAGMSVMLRPLIGEHIRLETALAPAPLRVKADQAQLEQAILNLAVNARDAMPEGGALTIGTASVVLDAAQSEIDAEVTPGRYALLSMSDTGLGMDAETRARIFEPFFTTKERAQATGMGLATVYGIVKQHRGHIAVDSEPTKGTTFRVYLPRTEEAAAVTADAVAGPVPNGSETILLVEDEDEVREIARDVLRGQGYTVLQSGSPREALAMAERHQGIIHLLLTDVVMPEMNGRELADRLRPAWPALRVLYMSGYTDDLIGRHGVLGPGVAFLEKPFTPARLTAKVREVLRAS